ncbi:MAG: class I SAM-dependent methyltransferase [Patulibacter sp.]|nr:class I SAM-dependent methyltransferase [Patulibacter sp.]
MSHSSSYDDVAYLSMPVRETDPLAMATVAALFGVDAVDPRSCDLLELGCGDGGNLMSLASAYPAIRAIGFDPARGAIERGREVLERTGLENVELVHDEAAVDLDGTMDYVYAHGVLSWVDEDVCREVVASAARGARPRGRGYHSYPVFPKADNQQHDAERDQQVDAWQIDLSRLHFRRVLDFEARENAELHRLPCQ